MERHLGTVPHQLCSDRPTPGDRTTGLHEYRHADANCTGDTAPCGDAPRTDQPERLSAVRTTDGAHPAGTSTVCVWLIFAP